MIGKGEDPQGLGRWSYIILRGRGTKKNAIVTAYNVSQKYHLERGERTAYKQQFRILSAAIREQNINVAPHPRRQFMLDLQAWLEHLIQNDHEIILAMDANEAYNPDVPGIVRSLTYQAGKLTSDKSHDGKLSTLIASCGLCDPLARQHPERPFPASYFRGQTRIDYILVTSKLLDAVQSSGSLPLYSLFQGDHRPYYIDLTAAIAFADNAYEIARPKGRGLQLHDPRIVSKYNEILTEQAAYHKLIDKALHFQETSDEGTWNESTTESYQRTDTLASETMIYAERKAGRKYTTAFDWSPQLHKQFKGFDSGNSN